MSRTSFYVTMIKQQLQSIEPVLQQGDPVHKTVSYILNQLFPDLELAVKAELPDPSDSEPK